jgi:CheY-like chemotaxis protein
MDILVIDDSLINQDSARQTLGNLGHNLHVTTSYEQGFRALTPLFDGYVQSGATGTKYDCVLSDLLMPASNMLMKERRWESEEQSLGWALVLRAVLNGAQYAAVVSTVGHHDHPAAYALDAIDNAEDTWYQDEQKYLPKKTPQFVINGARVGFFHAPLVLVQGHPGCYWQCDNGVDSRGNTCECCEGTGLAHGKDWGKVLACLIGEDE